MSLPHGPPLLLSLLLGPLLGALAWGFWRSRRSESGGTGIGDDVLLVFVLLAALAIGALLAYIFLVVDA